MRHIIHALVAAGLLSSAHARTVFAQPAEASAAPAPSTPPLPPLRTEQLGPGFHVLLGDIGNIAVSSGADGVLIVDDLVPRGAAQIQAAVAEITKQPLRFVVNTHWHRDHSGGNATLAKAGAIVVAHDNVRARQSAEQFMRGYNVKVPPAAVAARAMLTFGETMTFNLNGEVVRAFHVPNAHTDGDAIVHFVTANALHMGDVFFNGIFPYIDTASGGGVQGMIRAVDRALSLADDRTRIIPAHGAISDKKGLVAYRAMLTDVATKVQAGIRADRTLQAIQAEKPAAAYKGYEGDADMFVGYVYDSLASVK